MDLNVLASVSTASLLSSVVALLVVWALHWVRVRLRRSSRHQILTTVQQCVLLFAALFSISLFVSIGYGTGVAKRRYGYEGGLQLQLIAATSLMGLWLSVSVHTLCSVYDRRVLQIVSKKMKRDEWLPACITHVLTALCVCFLAVVGQNVCGVRRP